MKKKTESAVFALRGKRVELHFPVSIHSVLVLRGKLPHNQSVFTVKDLGASGHRCTNLNRLTAKRATQKKTNQKNLNTSTLSAPAHEPRSAHPFLIGSALPAALYRRGRQVTVGL